MRGVLDGIVVAVVGLDDAGEVCPGLLTELGAETVGGGEVDELARADILLEGPGAPPSLRWTALAPDRIRCRLTPFGDEGPLVGRIPNSDCVGLAEAGVSVDERGFVTVDGQLRTSQPHIHAIGDLVGPPMVAHKATHEAKVAAEAIAGEDVELDLRAIPLVAYTDPEVAWVGLTEAEATRTGAAHRVVRVPWAASGRAVTSDETDGLTKLIVHPEGNRILGVGVSGLNAGELIPEAGLAIELGTDTADVALTSHAHPTLAETLALAAEVAEGTVTDLPPRRR